MGALLHLQSTSRELVYLYQSHTVGRSANCHLVLSKPVISAHHATIRWAKGRWTVRDLGSRNGTFVNGERLPTGGDNYRELAEGDRVMFAEDDEIWELVDTTEPKPLLIPLGVDQPPLVLDERDMLALPTADEPLLTIYHQGSWRLDRDGDCSILQDRDVIELGEQRYRMMVTGVLESTVDAASRAATRWLANMRMDILVAADEESAAIVARFEDEVHELPPRTFLYLLAFLARRRLEDAEKGSDEGWIDVETTCHELGLTSAEALGLLVYRCRKAIQATGVDDPAALIDRSRKRRLRIGIAADRLSISRLD